jgi:hypothetical protein
MTEGHFLTLSTASAHALGVSVPSAQPKGPGPRVLTQSVRLSNGRWISGYPFLAAPFQALASSGWRPCFTAGCGAVR